MFSFAEFIDLPLLWSGIIAVAVVMYVLLDGFDLGLGILFPFAKNDKHRDVMINSIAPFWDGNETWLVLGGGGLFAAFPLAYAIVMPAIYIPVFTMLVALVFRGVAFEFRFKAPIEQRHFWDYAFHFGSLVATFFQGVILGAYVQGFTVENRAFAGGPFDWFSSFAVFCGFALLCGYMLMGSAWLIMKTEGNLQEWAFKIARRVSVLVVISMGVVSLWVPFLGTGIEERWFVEGAAFPFTPKLHLLPVPLLTLACVVGLFWAEAKKHDVAPFLFSVALFLLGFAGLAISIWPSVVPPDVSIWDAAAADTSLSLMLVGVVIMLPIILFYIGYVYWVFRGKVREDEGYTH